MTTSFLTFPPATILFLTLPLLPSLQLLQTLLNPTFFNVVIATIPLALFASWCTPPNCKGAIDYRFIRKDGTDENVVYTTDFQSLLELSYGADPKRTNIIFGYFSFLPPPRLRTLLKNLDILRPPILY
ncbi:hypothetical protein KY289_011575 [Solanum tuberosum]|nr:hypothetical protein KY289_011575 [Solanum tuberosum]